jgi:hypothetical protein
LRRENAIVNETFQIRHNNVSAGFAAKNKVNGNMTRPFERKRIEDKALQLQRRRMFVQIAFSLFPRSLPQEERDCNVLFLS